MRTLRLCSNLWGYFSHGSRSTHFHIAILNRRPRFAIRSSRATTSPSLHLLGMLELTVVEQFALRSRRSLSSKYVLAFKNYWAEIAGCPSNSPMTLRRVCLQAGFHRKERSLLAPRQGMRSDLSSSTVSLHRVYAFRSGSRGIWAHPLAAACMFSSSLEILVQPIPSATVASSTSGRSVVFAVFGGLAGADC